MCTRDVQEISYSSDKRGTGVLEMYRTSRGLTEMIKGGQVYKRISILDSSDKRVTYEMYMRSRNLTQVTQVIKGRRVYRRSRGLTQVIKMGSL